MILASAKVADFDQFLQTFSTKGAEKRKEHGSKGSRVFRDPEDASRVWVVFDWEVEDYEKFIADPEVPAIFQEAGLQSASQGGGRRPVRLLSEADRAQVAEERGGRRDSLHLRLARESRSPRCRCRRPAPDEERSSPPAESTPWTLSGRRTSCPSPARQQKGQLSRQNVEAL